MEGRNVGRKHAQLGVGRMLSVDAKFSTPDFSRGPQTLILQRSSSAVENFEENEAENRRTSAVVAKKKGAAHQEAPTLRRSVTPLKARWHSEMETIAQKTNDEEKRKVNSTTVGAPGHSCTPVARVVAAVAFNCTEWGHL